MKSESTISIRVEPELLRFLDEVTELSGLNRSSIIRSAIISLMRVMTDAEGYIRPDLIESLKGIKMDDPQR